MKQTKLTFKATTKKAASQDPNEKSNSQSLPLSLNNDEQSKGSAPAIIISKVEESKIEIESSGVQTNVSGVTLVVLPR